jgi:hypothetical protein
MSKAKTGQESLGAQIVYCSKTLLLQNFKWRKIAHCKTGRGGGCAGSARLSSNVVVFDRGLTETEMLRLTGPR